MPATARLIRATLSSVRNPVSKNAKDNCYWLEAFIADAPYRCIKLTWILVQLISGNCGAGNSGEKRKTF